MAKKNPKEIKKVKMGWDCTTRGNYDAIQMLFKNELILNSQIEFLISVMEKHGLIIKTEDENGKPIWKCTLD